MCSAWRTAARRNTRPRQKQKEIALNRYYNDPKDNAAFERCADIMAKLMLKYGLQVLEKLDEAEETKSSCLQEQAAA